MELNGRPIASSTHAHGANSQRAPYTVLRIGRSTRVRAVHSARRNLPDPRASMDALSDGRHAFRVGSSSGFQRSRCGGGRVDVFHVSARVRIRARTYQSPRSQESTSHPRHSHDSDRTFETTHGRVRGPKISCQRNRTARHRCPRDGRSGGRGQTGRAVPIRGASHSNIV